MKLNTLTSAPNARRSAKRVGRGIGSGFGKTCGRGHKGQKSRAGGFHKVGFEGGQMPLQRRLPKYGFTSRKHIGIATITLSELAKLHDADVINTQVVVNAGFVRRQVQTVRVIASGTINVSVTIKGLYVTKGARAAIEKAGGYIG